MIYSSVESAYWLKNLLVPVSNFLCFSSTYRAFLASFHCAIFAAILLAAANADAAARTASATGAWNAKATWGGSNVPTAGDTATINNNITVTVPTGYGAVCSSLTLPGANSQVTLSGTGTLTVSGNVTNAGIITAGSSTITVGGNWTNNGTFNVGTSTFVFNGAGTSAVSGDNTFNNLTCTTASKSITFAAGSTQTVGGLFRIDGAAVGTRVSLSSAGGDGTTWNLVLNGRHDCRFIAVQGSTASGTAFLPVNPARFMDNGDNTGWYDPSFPREMVFYDNFETSTLGATPPNKTSSGWTISGATGWLTVASTVVNTQNHTPGGSQSMYSAGGAVGVGTGCWNTPQWGPVTNGAAEMWIYDDMSGQKCQWACVDNAAGNLGIGIKIDPRQSATKYIYCANATYGVTYIDRSLGWHKIKWERAASTTYLYLDGVLVYTNATLSDFSAFDTGSWTTFTPAASTAMWFDDARVYVSQNQSRFRWYANDAVPTALAAENTTISRDIAATTRLNLQIQNDESQAWSGAYIGLQYREGLMGG